jgi:hypothetical protein
MAWIKFEQISRAAGENLEALKVFYSVGRIRAAGSSHIKTGRRHPLSNQFEKQLIIPLNDLKTGPREARLEGTCEFGID